MNEKQIRGWKALAEFWGKSVAQTKRDCRSGHLPAPRLLGASLVWDRAELDRLVAEAPRRRYAPDAA